MTTQTLTTGALSLSLLLGGLAAFSACSGSTSTADSNNTGSNLAGQEVGGRGQPCTPDGQCNANLYCYGSTNTCVPDTPDGAAPATTLSGTVLQDDGSGVLTPVDGVQITIEAVPGYVWTSATITAGAYTLYGVELQHYDLVIAGERFPVDVNTLPTQNAPPITIN
jgi:hypothetical protein